MTTETILIQAIGFAGVVFFILSYQIRSNRMLFLMQLLGTSMFCIQFLILGAYSGVLNLIIIIIRNVLFMKVREWKWVRSKVTLAVITAAAAAGCALTWQGWLSLLPFAATVATTIAYSTDNAQKIRLSNLVCGSPCWLVYDFIIGSWGGVLNESITQASIIVSIFRYGWKNMGNPDSGF